MTGLNQCLLSGSQVARLSVRVWAIADIATSRRLARVHPQIADPEPALLDPEVIG